MSSERFYADGLRFGCTQCSRCCRHDSGYVFLTEGDLNRLLKRLGISRESFVDSYCVWVPLGGMKQLSLQEKKNKDCIFWKDGGCSVYEDRPIQCRTYPFWQHLLSDQAAWLREKRECPGIGIGRTYSNSEIERFLEERRRSTPIRNL